MMEEMIEAFKWASGEPGAVLVVDAEGKAFSAGVDVADHTPDKVGSMIDVLTGFFGDGRCGEAHYWCGKRSSPRRRL